MSAINDAALACGKRALEPGAIARELPEFLFVTISGAHLYGFPSRDSDVDLRGCHVLPLNRVIGLADPDETFQSTSAVVEGLEVDCVSHDLRKYLKLLANKNGYVLEQIFSPLVVFDSGHLSELRVLAVGALTKHVVHHYKGFFAAQEKLVLKDAVPTAKAMLYLFRVAMSGLHLLRTGQVVANILELNSDFRLPFIDDLVARKTEGSEKGRLPENDATRLLAEARKLGAELDPAAQASALPDEVRNYRELDEFLRRMRMKTLRS